MSRFFLTSAIIIVFVNQIMGQTTTINRTENRNGRTETYTETVTQQTNGNSITTITQSSTTNMLASFGIQVGADWSNFIIRDVDDYQSPMNLGPSAGVFLKLESRHFALQYELLLRRKSLELPIYIMGQINAGSGKILIGAGPYLSLGIDGKQMFDNKIMRRWDFGLGLRVGYELKNGLSIFGIYQAGLINRLKEDDMTLRNQVVGFGLGYRF